MSKQQLETLQLGGFPRADLLPAAARDAVRRRPIVRRLVLGLVGLILVVVLAVVGATLLALVAQSQLDAERSRSETLLAQQLEFAEARTVDASIGEIETSRVVGTATEADWDALIAEIRATLPVGVALTSVDGSISGVPGEDQQGEQVPLREVSVGSFLINATSPTVPDVQAWLEDLEGLTGFAGIAPPSTVSGDEGSGFSVTIEVLLNEEAYLGRFVEDATSETED